MEEETLIDFTGPVQHETIGELIHELKHKSQRLGIKTGTYKKLLLVMIEALENIIKYNEYPPQSNGSSQPAFPTLKVERKPSQFRITTSNILNNSRINVISDKINYLNSLDPQGLKEYYKNTITNGEFSHKGGAGLGLIEMAKMSPYKIDFHFSAYNEEFSLYNLQVLIDN